MAKVVYTSFSVPPEGIFIGKVYNTGKDEKGHYYSDGKDKVYCDEDYIKTLFSHVDKSETKDTNIKSTTNEKINK